MTDLVRLKMTYQPDDVKELLGKTNFWVLDEDGVRRMVAGDDPRTLNIATGFPSPIGEDDTTLLAAFKASGEKDYTVVVFNESDVTSTYALEANGALLADSYGQTNESKVAALEQAALRGELPKPTPTPAPTARPITPLYGPTLTGELTNPFEHHYYGLLPEFVDGTMIVTMDFDPRDTQELAENINFMILDEDGWRRMIAGARPEDVDDRHRLRGSVRRRCRQAACHAQCVGQGPVHGCCLQQLVRAGPLLSLRQGRIARRRIRASDRDGSAVAERSTSRRLNIDSQESFE